MNVMENPIQWEEHLHLVEFEYNNEHEDSSKMNPFEILYGRKCNTLVSSDNLVDRIT